MNKNKFLNILFFSLNCAILIIIIFNFIYNFISLYYVLALFLFLNCVYLFGKFMAYNSDSGLFFGTMMLFCSIFLTISEKYGLNFMQLSALIFLSFIFACFFVYYFFNSIYFFYTFLSNFLMFFPIIFYSFHVIELNLLFIFILCCVIINLILYFVIIKSVKRIKK